MGMNRTAEETRQQVRARYAAAASAVNTEQRASSGPSTSTGDDGCCATGETGGCCSAASCASDTAEVGEGFGAGLYTAEEQAAATNVEFVNGTIEACPLPGGTIDVVISNCVINLSVDKAAVIAEMFRLLKPGGRIGISDVVAEDHLSPKQRAERGSYVGCIAGALSRAEYLDGLTAVGFADSSVTFTHQAADGMHSAIIRATKPAPAGQA